MLLIFFVLWSQFYKVIFNYFTQITIDLCMRLKPKEVTPGIYDLYHCGILLKYSHPVLLIKIEPSQNKNNILK